jgi:hypothetical protein
MRMPSTGKRAFYGIGFFLEPPKRAEAALAGGAADQATQEKVAAIIKDLEFVARLDQIRQSRATIFEGEINLRRGLQDYARAFRSYGVDVEQLPTATAVARLQEHLPLAIPVAAALDDWALARRGLLGKGDPGWKALVAVARGLDPHRLRDRLRASWEQPLTPELQAELQRLAGSLEIPAQSPATLSDLGETLLRAQLPHAAMPVLKEGQAAHPEDFWLNFLLGSSLLLQKKHAMAVRYCSVAVSLRPKSVAALTNLGNALQGLSTPFRKCLGSHAGTALW